MTEPEPGDLAAWRRERRAEMIAQREALELPRYRGLNATVTQHLLDAFPGLAGLVVGFCWPYKREFDVRFAVHELREGGSRVALPVVEKKATPLRFFEWWPGAPVKPGVFGLPIPQGTEELRPQALLIPPVGFDDAGYRLGYGGGFFDRTLAAADPVPLKIGVGFEVSRLRTIFPQPHDIPMDFVVTEAGVHRVADGALHPVDAAQAAQAFDQIRRERSGGGRGPVGRD